MLALRTVPAVIGLLVVDPFHVRSPIEPYAWVVIVASFCRRPEPWCRSGSGAFPTELPTDAPNQAIREAVRELSDEQISRNLLVVEPDRLRLRQQD